MTDDTPDEPQSFTSFLELVKRLEKIVEETPDTVKQKIDDKDTKISEPQEELETISEKKESELEDVQKQAQDLEIQTVEKEKELKVKKKIQSILTIEEELIKYYSDADVQISDFYYFFKELSTDKIEEVVRSKFHSLENIKVEKPKIIGVPFVLCKLNGKYEASLQLEIDRINLPFTLVGNLKQLKLLAASVNNDTNLSPEEIEIWNQTFNKFQLKLVQLLNEKAKENLSKHQTTEYDLLELDHTIIQEFIGEYEKKVKELNYYNIEILEQLKKLEKEIDEKRIFWQDNPQYLEATEKLKNQVKNMQEEQISINKETQIQYLKLKKNQKSIDAKTKRYKIEEKRGKKVSREDKEKLVRQLREFQKEKDTLQKRINDVKKLEETYETWLGIVSCENEKYANEILIENFSSRIKEKLKEITKDLDKEDLLEILKAVTTELETITIHVIYIPSLIYYFSAKQDGKKMEGKILYISPTDEIAFLKPSLF
ncbi:MAG: hypothetical protein ACFFDS_09235 [Candidatus Thorarchaeota archaeon]